jgi:hypothetical protein
MWAACQALRTLMMLQTAWRPLVYMLLRFLLWREPHGNVKSLFMEGGGLNPLTKNICTLEVNH